ncbi:MAG: hypothetical protein WKH64_15340 [Chloroflexia bacterium]
MSRPLRHPLAARRYSAPSSRLAMATTVALPPSPRCTQSDGVSTRSFISWRTASRRDDG